MNGTTIFKKEVMKFVLSIYRDYFTQKKLLFIKRKDDVIMTNKNILSCNEF